MTKRMLNNTLLLVLMAACFGLLSYLEEARAGEEMGKPGGFGHGPMPPVRIINDPHIKLNVDPRATAGAVAGAQAGAKATASGTGGTATGTGGAAQANYYGSDIPANQTLRIENTPGLGAMYTPGVNPCTMSFSGQAVGPGTGAGATVPFYSLPCHFQELAKTTASIGVAAVNVGAIGAPDQAVVAAGRNAVVDALDLLAGTDVNLYLLRKAQGRTPPIRPDRDLMDNLPGGLIDRHVIPAEYQPPRPEIKHHDYGHIPDSRKDNQAIDNRFKEEMEK
jgi:hypothetical protein